MFFKKIMLSCFFLGFRGIKMSTENFYTKVFSIHQPGTMFVKWCWPAFIFGPLWLAYRRCYLYATLFALIGFLSSHYFYGMYDGLFAYDGMGIVFRLHYGGELDFYNFNPDVAIAFLVHLFLGLYGVALYGKVWNKTQVNHLEHETVGFMFLWLFLKNLLFVALSFIIFQVTDETPKAVIKWEIKKNN
jgi:hypothetical protein